MGQVKYNWNKRFGARVEKQVQTWQLKDWESNILWRVLFAGGANSALSDANLDRCEQYFAVMRGTIAGLKPFTRAEIDSFTWEYGLLADIGFAQRFLRTVYVAVNFADTDLADGLRSNLEDLTQGNMLFDGLEQAQQRDFYRALYLELCFDFFTLLQEKVQLFILSSDLFVLSVKLQFPVEEKIAENLDSLVSFDRRQKLALDYATFLISNETPVGTRSSEPSTLKNWLELFRSYSSERLEAIDLIKFLDDSSYMGECSEEAKETIRVAAELYVHLVSGTLIVPDGNLEEIYKLATEIAKVDATAGGKGPNWAYFVNSPSISSGQINSIELWMNSQADSQVVLRQIVNAVKLVTDWEKEEKIANLFIINDLFEKRFGAGAGSIVYFDESKGKFVLSE